MVPSVVFHTISTAALPLILTPAPRHMLRLNRHTMGACTLEPEGQQDPGALGVCRAGGCCLGFDTSTPDLLCCSPAGLGQLLLRLGPEQIPKKATFKSQTVQIGIFAYIGRLEIGSSSIHIRTIHLYWGVNVFHTWSLWVWVSAFRFGLQVVRLDVGQTACALAGARRLDLLIVFCHHRSEPIWISMKC